MKKLSIKGLIETTQNHQKYFIGYPWNQKWTPFSSELQELLGYTTTNIGNPLHQGTIKYGTREFEQEIILYYAQKYNLPSEEVFGYIGGSGSKTNEQGIMIAKHNYPQGEVFYSESTHYSVGNACKKMSMSSNIISSQLTGEINYESLRQSLQSYQEQCDQSDIPCTPIIILTAGTTVTGAIDKPKQALSILQGLGIKEYYIHIDAALAGGFLPFIQDENKPNIGFDLNIDSISISGHKRIGSPMPAGIFLTRRKLIESIDVGSEYLGNNDITGEGCRNGLSPVILYEQIQQRGDQGSISEIKQCLELTNYLTETINNLVPQYDAWHNPYSTTVVFTKPSEYMVNKYQLACQGNIAHIVVMQHVTKKIIDEFVQDLVNDGIYNRELLL